MKDKDLILLEYYESRLVLATDPVDIGALKILIAKTKQRILKAG
jgi:hypothetical protein